VRYDAEVAAAVTQARRFYAVAPDATLVHALIQKETSHGPYSIKGTLEPNGLRSYGPMQVLSTTAAMHGIADPDTLNIPSVGIRIGTFELARLLTKFPGDSARAVAAYNAGAGNSTRNPSTGKFFNQDYVDKVLGFWNQYRGVVTQAAPAAALVALGLMLVFVLARRRPALAH